MPFYAINEKIILGHFSIFSKQRRSDNVYNDNNGARSTRWKRKKKEKEKRKETKLEKSPPPLQPPILKYETLKRKIESCYSSEAASILQHSAYAVKLEIRIEPVSLCDPRRTRAKASRIDLSQRARE